MLAAVRHWGQPGGHAELGGPVSPAGNPDRIFGDCSVTTAGTAALYARPEASQLIAVDGRQREGSQAE